MWRQLGASLDAFWRKLRAGVAAVALLIGRGLLLGWQAIRPALVLVFQILAALLLLFEEWGWRPLSALLARLARFPLWAETERIIAGLPPYAALVVLAVPSVVLVPAKLIGVYMFATGHFFVAAMVIFLAKIASTALITRIFMLTQPSLMQIPWFARAYEVFVPWKDAMFARIRASWVWRYGRAVKWRARNYLRRVWAGLRPEIAAAWLGMRPAVSHALSALRSAGRDLSARVGQALQRLRPPHGRL